MMMVLGFPHCESGLVGRRERAIVWVVGERMWLKDRTSVLFRETARIESTYVVVVGYTLDRIVVILVG